MPITPLRKTPKRKREKVRDFLTNISEKNKLLDLLYSSPEESFDETIGGSFAFGVTPKGHHDRDSRKSGDMQMVLGEGLKDLWRQSGSPRIKMHDNAHASYEPSESSWEYGKKTPLSFMKKMFGSDKIYLPKDEFGGADKGMAISELAHGMRFADPEQFSKYGSRKELVLGKGQEHAEDELYHSPGTDEYETHREVEPVLRDWLIKNYSAGFQEGGSAERAPLLGYMQPSIQDETAHSQMDNIIEENTILGHVTGLLSNLGLMDEPIKHAAGLPPLTTTKGHEELKWLGERLTREPDIEYVGGSGTALEAIGAVGKAGSLISATKDPIWKYATGKSLLKAMESSIKESLPKIFPEKPIKWLTHTRRTTKFGKDLEEIYTADAAKNVEKIRKMGKEAGEEMERIAKALHNVDLNLPKIKPMKPTDFEKIEEARNVLDMNLAEGISEFSRLGTMSPSRVGYIDNLNKTMKNIAKKYYSKPGKSNEFENMRKHLIEYYEPSMFGGTISKMNKNEKWSFLTKELNRMPPPDQRQILGKFYEPYKIWNTLIGRTRAPFRGQGVASRNLQLKPDVLNPDIVPVGKRRPK